MQNYTDRPTLAAFNEKCSVLTGYYTGNGTTDRVISLGVTPKVVLVAGGGNRMREDNVYYGGVSINGYSASGVNIVEGGFRVTYINSVNTNAANARYVYVSLY